MEKLLGQNIKDLEARRQFMIDNADECEDKTFTKQLTAEELATLRVDHSENAVKIADLQSQLDTFKAGIKVQMKPLVEANAKILADLRMKGTIVTEKCCKIIDREEGMVGFYTMEGVLIESRPATSEECDPTILSVIRDAHKAEDAALAGKGRRTVIVVPTPGAES